MVQAAARPVSFIEDAVEIDCSAGEVEERLGHPDVPLRVLAADATSSGNRVLVPLGPAIGARIVGVPAHVQLGARWTRGGSAAIPIRWEAATFGTLFPVLDGTLLVRSLGADRCRFAIEASYRPPLDALGAFLDRAVLHHLAHATVHEFLSRLGIALSTPPEPDEAGESPTSSDGVVGAAAEGSRPPAP